MIRVLLEEVVKFINQVYFVDVCAVAAMYPEWFKIGSGVRNYLAVPDLPLDSAGSSYDLARRLHHGRKYCRACIRSKPHRTRCFAIPSPKTSPTPTIKAESRCIRGPEKRSLNSPAGMRIRNIPG